MEMATISCCVVLYCTSNEQERRCSQREERTVGDMTQTQMISHVHCSLDRRVHEVNGLIMGQCSAGLVLELS